MEEQLLSIAQDTRQFGVLYGQFGYKKYKMSRFEEYTLYAENMSFLGAGESVVTFPDRRGRLMALKPDVTLSIVNNTRAALDAPEKIYYTENVYRMTGSPAAVKEILQVGLEHIGQMDDYAICEALTLAVRSLKMISEKFLLALSHMGFISALLNEAGLAEDQCKVVLKNIRSKNSHDLRNACTTWGLTAEMTEKLIALSALTGAFEPTLQAARALSIHSEALDELDRAYQALKAQGYGEQVILDFSIVNDMSYYTGIIFQGYVEGIPSALLTGGRYDKLLEKLKKPCGAIGFAIQLNLLELLPAPHQPYDVDVLLQYDADTEAKTIMAHQAAFAGQTVRVQPVGTNGIRAKACYIIEKGRLTKV